MHPSYRDLIIDELANSNPARVRFLQQMSISGIKLAISDTGGAIGERTLPLLKDNASWELFKTRCLEVASNASWYERFQLLTTLGDAVKHFNTSGIKNKITDIIIYVCKAITIKWESDKAEITSYELSVFVRSSLHTKPLVGMPDLRHSWDMKYGKVNKALNFFDDGELPDFDAIAEWVKFASIIQDSEPRFLLQVDFPNSQIMEFQKISSIIEYELENKVDEDSSDDLQEKIDKLESIESVLRIIGRFSFSKLRFLTVTKNKVSEMLETLNQSIDNLRQEKDDTEIEDDFEESLLEKSDSLDIEELFNDL